MNITEFQFTRSWVSSLSIKQVTDQLQYQFTWIWVELETNATLRHAWTNWLLSMWWSSGSIQSSLWKFFSSVFHPLSPANIRRKPISADSIHDLIFWVCIQISGHGHKGGLHPRPDAEPTCLSDSCSILPSFMIRTSRHLNSPTLGSSSPPTQIEQSTILHLRTVLWWSQQSYITCKQQFCEVPEADTLLTLGAPWDFVHEYHN